MKLKNKKIGFGITGSYCTFLPALQEIISLINEGAEVFPILSQAASSVDTRFGKAADWLEKLRVMTGREPITTIEAAEPIGPKNILDVLLIAPCTGNTLAKFANGITDTPVLMAAKAQLRNIAHSKSAAHVIAR